MPDIKSLRYYRLGPPVSIASSPEKVTVSGLKKVKFSLLIALTVELCMNFLVVIMSFLSSSSSNFKLAEIKDSIDTCIEPSAVFWVAFD